MFKEINIWRKTVNFELLSNKEFKANGALASGAFSASIIMDIIDT